MEIMVLSVYSDITYIEVISKLTEEYCGNSAMATGSASPKHIVHTTALIGRWNPGLQRRKLVLKMET